MKLYQLFIDDSSLSKENYKEEFDIGIFSSYEIAFKTYQKYITEIDGFKDYPCQYRIEEKSVILSSTKDKSDEVFIICGWNTDNNLDETDIFESECYTCFDYAKSELNKLKAKYKKDEWYINKYIIDECLWTQGFKRA